MGRLARLGHGISNVLRSLGRACQKDPRPARRSAIHEITRCKEPVFVKIKLQHVSQTIVVYTRHNPHREHHKIKEFPDSVTVLFVSIANGQLALFPLKDIPGHKPHEAYVFFTPFIKPGEILAAILNIHVEDGNLYLRVTVAYGLSHAHTRRRIDLGRHPAG